ncbi:helix-turn-helix domain-containing protein [Marinobacter sp. ELB17]|uniref:AlbA family DNA-binding domain-containing protein n=1 Tax=Marinobacter sp. ELB17 TaxID=270374 RepID=UPI0000F38ECC|nr:ATP-binding protein [Marinobacter sp. ELB17]EBA00914.1 hypothetical protein MELB17_17714 [Marinobacter sp. ELB17]
MDQGKLVKDLLFHIRLGEDSSIEFKAVTYEGERPKDPNRDKMAHEIAAFANGQGGRLVLGVSRSISVHQSAGRYYQRVGSTKQEMKPEVLARLFQQRSQARLIRFDEALVPGTQVEDIDKSLKQRFLKPNTLEKEQLHKLHLTAKDDYDEGLSVCGVCSASTILSGPRQL